jgi:hypothetical protein
MGLDTVAHNVDDPALGLEERLDLLAKLRLVFSK